MFYIKQNFLNKSECDYFMSLVPRPNNDIRLKYAGTQVGQFKNVSSDLEIHSSVQDKDILFKGDDGGSEITALTLDMSDGGTASFAKHVKLVDGAKVYLGTGGDLELFHDGNNGYIKDK